MDLSPGLRLVFRQTDVGDKDNKPYYYKDEEYIINFIFGSHIEKFFSSGLAMVKPQAY